MDVLLRVDVVAARFGVRPGRVYELVRLNALPAVHLGRTIRIPQSALETFIANGGVRRAVALGDATAVPPLPERDA
jgi:excisionase family DNA binding protein